MKDSIDFNDIHIEQGLEHTKLAVVKPAEQFYEQKELEAEKDNDLLNPPPVLAPEGFYGVLKEICKISTQYSEASEVAIASNVIATFSAMIGRVAFQHIGDGICHARPFFLLTGRTGKARKGTSEYTPYRIFKKVEQILNQTSNDEHPILKRHEGGLSTGEGLGWTVHDDILNKEGEVIEEGETDKRLYVVEAEFAGCIAAASREKNNLSATIRTIWDGKSVSPLVKNAKWCATAPHIVISAHITSSELIDRMSDVDAQSGFMNRFIILHIVRPKLVPLPKRTADEAVLGVALKIAEAVKLAMGEPGTENNSLEVKLSPEANKYWCGQYRELTKEQPGIIGSLLVRTEIYCRMLAMIFALLDKSLVVEVQHIKAALAWINYWKHSVNYIFGTLAAKAEASKMNETAKNVYEYISKHSGCTRTDLTKFFKHKLNANEMTSALNHLMNAAPPLIRQETRPRADGKAGKGTVIFWKV